MIPESAVGEHARRDAPRQPRRAALGLAAVQASTADLHARLRARAPATTSRRARRASPVGLSRVGVTGVEKVVRIRDELFFARLDCFVDLSRDQKGAHMSRFEEVVNEAIGEVVLSESPFRAETLAQHIAELVRERQGAERAEVTIAARYPEHKPAPVSGVQTQEIYTLLRPRGRLRARHAPHGRRVGDRHDRVPVRAGAGRRARARAAAPTRASARSRSSAILEQRARRHPQPARPRRRCRSAASRTCDAEIDAARAAGDRRGEHVLGDLRADEALRRGRGRREGPPPPALRRGLRARDDRRRRRARSRELDGASFVSARQENLETIHQHNVVAERHGLLAELRAEIDSGAPAGAPDEPRGVARRRRAAAPLSRRR